MPGIVASFTNCHTHAGMRTFLSVRSNIFARTRAHFSLRSHGERSAREINCYSNVRLAQIRIRMACWSGRPLVLGYQYKSFAIGRLMIGSADNAPRASSFCGQPNLARNSREMRAVHRACPAARLLIILSGGANAHRTCWACLLLQKIADNPSDPFWHALGDTQEKRIH